MEYKEQGIFVKKKRRQISITNYTMGVLCNPEKAARSKITGWNEGMSRRLGAYIDNFRQDFKGMVTLTYPDQFPEDGRLVKSHYRAFIERLRRTGWFKKDGLVWFLEFQERGAPHLHFLITGWLSKNWVAHNWADITQGNPESCSRVEQLRNPESAGCYAKKYAQKSEQKAVPAGFSSIGRMWGVSASLFIEGESRVPTTGSCHKDWRAAALEGILKGIIAKTKVRLAETKNGFVLYGNQTEIKFAYEVICAEMFLQTG